MSQFLNYEDTCKNYDNGRRASGVDIIVGLIRIKLNKDLKDIRVLDAGCGTGNYSVSLSKFGVRNISMIDASNGMLSKAKEKIDAMNLSDYVDVKQAFLPKIPFADNTFDVVMINQVLHHLDEKLDGENFPTILETFREVKRVLAPSGLLFITSMVKEQLDGMWYYHLNKEFMRRYSLKFPSVTNFKKMLCDSQFEVMNCVSFLGHDPHPTYANLEGPLYKSHRDSDSYWGVATEQELQETLNRVRQMKENGTLQEFYSKHDKIDAMGYFVILAARNTP